MSRRRWAGEAARTAALRVLAERGGLAVTLVFYLLVTVVLASLWRAAVGANGGNVAGYSVVAITWYVAMTEATTVSIRQRLISDVGREIGSGAIAVELLRPASVLGVRFAAEIGHVLPRLAACALTGAVFSVLVAGPPPHAGALALALPSLALAVACNIAAQYAFAGTAFWLRDAGSAWFIYQKLVFVMGGMLIPLEALPGWLHQVASVLPFRAMSYAPARLASGHFEPVLLVEQAGWLAVLLVAAGAVFRAGERRLQVVGG
jgi:ABC-2 type transport system permease protein